MRTWHTGEQCALSYTATTVIKHHNSLIAHTTTLTITNHQTLECLDSMVSTCKLTTIQNIILAPVSLTLTRWPWCTCLLKMNFLRGGFQNEQQYRQTDTHIIGVARGTGDRGVLGVLRCTKSRDAGGSRGSGDLGVQVVQGFSGFSGPGIQGLQGVQGCRCLKQARKPSKSAQSADLRQGCYVHYS